MNKNLTQFEPERLSRQQIEEHASLLLKKVLPEMGDDSSPPDLQKVVYVLETKFNVKFCFTEYLGNLSGGHKILGMFAVSPLTISVCSSVPLWSTDFRRTLAHELGHLVLHRDMIGEGKYISRERRFVDTAIKFRYRENAEFSDLNWVEWQANEFSMCLILPRRFLNMLVVSVQNQMGIRRNLGKMYLDDQQCNINDCHIIVNQIATLSGVNTTWIWRRLRFLGILEDHQKKSARPLFAASDSLFGNIVQQDEVSLVGVNDEA